MTRRRDNKGRVLNPGEIQLPSGKYRYRYTNLLGEHHDVYSWRLVVTDPQPPGRTLLKPLRVREEEINRLQAQGIVDSDTTVNELVERYISIKVGVTENTKSVYRTVRRLLTKYPFGNRKVTEIKTSDAKLFLVELQRKHGKGYSTIQNVRGVLRPAFQMAVDDDMLLKNPFGFELHTVVVNDSKKREAITREQRDEFLDFVKKDDHYSRYYEAFALLFFTGLRISEFCGLTVKDIDFEQGYIHVNKQLLRNSSMEYSLEKTKTSSGVRDIPMTDKVRSLCEAILDKRPKIKCEPIVKGASGFLFYDKNNRPLVAMHWQKHIQFAREKYNKTHDKILPEITPHICRHTFCTLMAQSGIDPKSLQYLMGHSEISVTLNVYTHMDAEHAKAELIRLQAISS